jgi:hypothetical protein
MTGKQSGSAKKTRLKPVEANYFPLVFFGFFASTLLAHTLSFLHVEANDIPG